MVFAEDEARKVAGENSDTWFPSVGSFGVCRPCAQSLAVFEVASVVIVPADTSASTALGEIKNNITVGTNIGVNALRRDLFGAQPPLTPKPLSASATHRTASAP